MTLQFQHINLQTAAVLRRYYEHCSYHLCEYSLGIKLSWGHVFHGMFTEAEGCLIVRNFLDGRWCFDFPVPGPEGDVDAALERIEEYCREMGVYPVFVDVPEAELPRLMARYPYYRVKNPRLWQDYLYRAEDLQTFAGRKYSGQRNHINKFRRLYPNYRFRPLTMLDDLSAFWAEFDAGFHKEGSSAKAELHQSKSLVHLACACPWFCTGCLEVDGEIAAVAVGERCGDTMVVHIEKALQRFEGIYPVMVTEFAQHWGGDALYFNREDDSCDKGLRTSKLQYLPAFMGRKYTLEVESELTELHELPEIETSRLTLDALQERDSAAYDALCLDDARNRLWGYDYKQDLKGEVYPGYFLDVARRDFENRLAINLAIRLEGRFIGEAVLYNLDFRGGAELGLRIAADYAGQGYGAEAYAAVADWCLYELGLQRVKGKCFKENEASRRMLSACMRPKGEDETYYYFEKLV